MGSSLLGRILCLFVARSPGHHPRIAPCRRSYRPPTNHAKLPLSSLPLRSSGGRLPCSLTPIFFGATLCSSCALVRALGIARLTARNPSSPSSLTHASIHLPTPLACQPDGFVVSLQETARHAPRHRTHSHRTQGYRAPSERAPARPHHTAPQTDAPRSAPDRALASTILRPHQRAPHRRATIQRAPPAPALLCAQS